jgi:hypothetical protein
VKRSIEAGYGSTSTLTFWSRHAGASAGKFGPFLGITEQWFPKDTPGEFKNAVTLFGGLLRFVLSGRYEPSDNQKIIVRFQKVDAYFANVLVRFITCTRWTGSMPCSRKISPHDQTAGPL